MNNPKVSVIVPVFNMEKYLHKCVDSILAQTFEDFELLLIDDGSKDASGAICDEYAIKDTRVRVFHKPNGGVSSARNMGLDNAHGQHITFVDADDWIEADLLTTTVSSIAGAKHTTTICGVKRPDGKRPTIATNIKKDEKFPSVGHYVKRYELCEALWGIVYERCHIEEINLRFNEELSMSEDSVFNMQYFATYKGNIYCIRKGMYIYNNANPDSACLSSFNMSKYISHVKATKIISKISSQDDMLESIQHISRRNCRYLIDDLAFILPPPSTHGYNTCGNMRAHCVPFMLTRTQLSSTQIQSFGVPDIFSSRIFYTARLGMR